METRSRNGIVPKCTAPATLQTWPVAEAPQRLLALLDASQAYDWVALVPAELNDPEVVSLLCRNLGNETAETRKLDDGSLLLGGYFAGKKIPAVDHPALPIPKVRRARSSGR